MDVDEIIRFLEDTGVAEEEFRDWADAHVSDEQMASLGYPDEEPWDKPETWEDIWQKAPDTMKTQMAEDLIRWVEGQSESRMRSEYNLWSKKH